MMACDYQIITVNAADRLKLNRFLTNFDFREVLTKIVQNMCIYGNAWVELVRDATDSRIVALDWIDPKSMDFLRDEQQNIIYAPDGFPKAYVQYVRFEDELKGVPKRLQIEQFGRKAILFERERIAHFPFYTVGDNLDGIGLIEPLFNVSQGKLNIQEGLAQFAYRKGIPLLWAKVGDEAHPPSPEEIDDLTKKLRGISYRTEIVTPYYHDLQLLESKTAERKQEILNYNIDQQVAGLGVPRAFVVGSADRTNRATLELQNFMFEQRIKTLQ